MRFSRPTGKRFQISQRNACWGSARGARSRSFRRRWLARQMTAGEAWPRNGGRRGAPPVRARRWSLRGRNSRLPQDRKSGLARASAARRARRAAHRMCAVQSALIRGLGTSFSLNMTGTSKQELKMHAQAEPERPKGEGHGWPEFYSPQMRPQGHGDSEFSLSRIPTAQTPVPRPYIFRV